MRMNTGRRRARTLALSLVALAAVGCRDEQPDIASPTPSASTAPAASASGPAAPLARFDVKLAVAGSFRPGQPIAINAIVTALHATQDADIQILLPEVQLGDLTEWRFDRSPVGTPIAANKGQRGGMGAGSVTQLSTTITVPRPGYYRALALATKRSNESDFDGAAVYTSAGRAEVWFIVDADGGRVTGEFDLGQLPASWQPLIGPAVPRRGTGQALQAVTAQRAQASLRPGPRLNTMISGASTRQLVYFNEDISAYSPIPNVDVIYHYIDSYDGAQIGNGSFVTDAQGMYETPCTPYSNSYSDTEYWYTRGDIEIQVPYPRWAGAGEGECASAPSFAVILQPADVAHVFVQMNQAAANARAIFGYARALRTKVEIRPARSVFFPVGCDLTISQYGTPGTGAEYCAGRDVILIVNSGPNAAIFQGRYGTWTMAHEYGHSYQWGALGGTAVAGNCGGGNHALETAAPNAKCAMSEGFADYFAAITMGVGVGAGRLNQLVSESDFTASVDANGLMWEEAVAGYLLDLTDPAGDEWFDSVQLSPVDLANVFRTCKIDNSLVRGADEVFYCIDRQIDASIRTIFGSTSGSITALAPLPSGWSESVRLAARSLGLHDLRKQ